MTYAATTALKNSSSIIGYKTYLELIPEFLKGKNVVSSSMMKEVERGKKALDMAEDGNTVALVSGGDPGIYAMAGLVFELAQKGGYLCRIEIIPGLAAINSCAARLGAPLMHDFAAISLSDLLTPMEVILRRLEAAASADFVTAIYNPRSKKRTRQIVQTQEIFLKYRNPETVVGIVTNATRENENIIITSLANMLDEEIGMQSTVIIGNSQTYRWGDIMVTPRGYSDKYSL